MSSGLILSGISTQPKVVACNIDGPTQIKLPTLYGASITNGAQNIVEAPTIKLTNCPGAIDGISYNFDASYYGTQNAANGVLKTASGDGYAKTFISSYKMPTVPPSGDKYPYSAQQL